MTLNIVLYLHDEKYKLLAHHLEMSIIYHHIASYVTGSQEVNQKEAIPGLCLAREPSREERWL